jgi:hypothetical protein
VVKDGKRVARWRVRGKLRSSPLTTGADGQPRIATRAATYTAKYRDHTGAVVERANLRRAVLRVAAECGFATLADLSREGVERWLSAQVVEKMSARTRNYYRESLVAFANWCQEMGRLREHDLHRIPKADEKADPRRPLRALTEDELTRLLAVAQVRPLAEARTVRRGKNKGKAVARCRTRRRPGWPCWAGSGRCCPRRSS